MSDRKKRVVWTHRDDQLLLKLWAERATDLGRAKRKRYIYSKISAKMCGKFSAKDIHVKIRNLTQTYRHERKKFVASGDKTKWRLYNEVHQILGQNADNTAEEYESISQDSKFDKSYNALAEAVAVMSTPAPSSSSSSASSKAELLTPLLTRSALSSPVPPHSPSPDPLQLPRRKPATTTNSVETEMIKLMHKQTEMLQSLIEDNKELTNEIVTALREQNETSNEFLALMKSLIEKI
ncbi:uncharacterized protein LOC101453118 [Ceratitis capitata]|uniref:Myb/SANT-like DNA-binding domain-containing protein n=1 Tax=Ceratitis capitata TaxID=7213 RepID=W8C399_CERCA|nr:uncharacterized protein LOC101453118 [Ceratitis capitata]